MKTTIIDRIRGRDLPREWARQADVGPDELVEVTIQPPRDKRLRELFAIMDRAAKEAKQRGLTEEKLQELLKDDD